jgi:putative transcriptional regulator
VAQAVSSIYGSFVTPQTSARPQPKRDKIGTMEVRAHFALASARVFCIAAAAVALLASAASAARSRLFVPAQAPARAEDLAAGKILVARRSLVDPNFAETVILLVQHDEKGTVGLIINRQTKIPLSRLSKELEGAKGRPDPLYLGGPVETAGLMALLRSRTKLEDARHVSADLYMISSKTALEKTIASPGSANTFRLYLGYAGWDAGQLEWELGMDAWDILAADAAIVFDPHPESLWTRLAQRDEQRMVYLRKGTSPIFQPGAPPAGHGLPHDYFAAMNSTSTGMYASIFWPVGVRRPVFGSMWKTTRVSES